MPTLLETARFKRNKYPRKMDFRRKIFLVLKNNDNEELKQMMEEYKDHPGKLGYIKIAIARHDKKLKF